MKKFDVFDSHLPILSSAGYLVGFKRVATVEALTAEAALQLAKKKYKLSAGSVAPAQNLEFFGKNFGGK